MPGPSNNKRKNKQHSKKQKIKIGDSQPSLEIHHCVESDNLECRRSASIEGGSTPSPTCTPSLNALQLLSFHDYSIPEYKAPNFEEHVPATIEKVMFQEPFIHDPGNGPRVRDARAFMASFFALPPALDDPLCAEFAQDEVLQMLCTVLPEETALILWYNKSRSESRVCPACQRLYRIGDALQDLLDEGSTKDKPSPPQLLREQKMSGLCSPVCFIMASFNYPSAIKLAWGCMADEMDESSWALLNGSGVGASHNDVSHTLGMLVRMTRLHDLGLAQLCFGAEESSIMESAEFGNRSQSIPVY